MLCVCCFIFVVCFFQQKTAYELRISDCGSDVCSSDLSIEEMGELAARFVARGVRRIRLTGGEPLVRRGIDTLATRVGALIGHGLDELTLTRSEASRVGKECVNTCSYRW